MTDNQGITPPHLSKCHQAPTKLVGGSGDFSDHEEGITMHYECSECGKACDLFVEIEVSGGSGDASAPPTPETPPELESLLQTITNRMLDVGARLEREDKEPNPHKLMEIYFKEATQAITQWANSKVVDELKLYQKDIDKIESIAIHANSDMLDRIKALESKNG